MISIFLQCIAALAAVALLLLAARPLGNCLAGAAPTALRGSVALLGGLGLLSLLLFAIGHLIWARSWLLALLLLLSAWGLVTCGWPRWQLRWPLAGRWWWLITLPIGALLFLGALALPAGNMGDDDVAYHLAGPALWRQLHHIAPLVGNFPAMYPQLVETLWGALLVVANARAVGVLAMVLAVCLFAQAWGLVKDFGGDDWTAAAAMAVLACMPVAVGLANRAYVDMVYAAFSLLAARLAWAAKRDRDWLLAGCFLGFSADIKYLGLFVIAATILTLVLLARSHPSGRVGVRQLGLLSIASAMVGCVWYMRNLLVTGAPIYPMPTALHWPNRYLPAADVLRFEGYMHARSAAFGHGLNALLLAPFQFTYETHVFHGGGGIGVLPLALVPLLLPKLLRKPVGRYWLVWSTLLTGIWIITEPEARYLIPMITVWAVFASLAAGDLLRRREWLLRGPALAAVLVSLAYGMGAVAWFDGARLPRLRSLTSISAERAWLHRSVPFAAAMDCLNRPDHAGGRVAILRGIDVVTYFLRRDYVLLRGPYGEQPLGPLSLGQLLQQAPALHVTEVLDTRSDFGPFQLNSTPPGWHLECQSSDARVYRAPAGDP